MCCREFRSKLGACKHLIVCHENYKENRQKEKFQSNLKSAVDVRVTSLSKLLLNKLSPLEIIKQATEIVVRDPNISGEELEESSEDEILVRTKHRDHNISGEESDESSEDEILVRKRRREPDLSWEESRESSEDEILERQKVEANYHVSEFCSICRASKTQETPPILAEILFENRNVEFPVKFFILW